MKSDKRSTIASERRAQAFGLRRAGFTFAEIGAQVGISKQAAHGLIKRELARLTVQTEKDAGVLRELELVRLDSMTQALWETAMTGDCQAVDRLLRISERRSKLLGMDAPTQASIDFPGQVPVVVYIPDNGRD